MNSAIVLCSLAKKLKKEFLKPFPILITSVVDKYIVFTIWIRILGKCYPGISFEKKC